MTTLILNSELQGGKYTIKKILGQGGFGITYLAQQNLLNRQVAIKEFFMKDYCVRVSNTNAMQVGVPEKKIFVERFRTQFIREAQKIASLNHGNIIKIHDIFEENNTAYYVMEYHENGSLADLISRHPNGMPEETAIAYITEVASAVDYIHDNRIMHLDIKPANILLNEKNSPILIDFGSSRLYNPDGNLVTTTLVGVSEGYAPIEQYMPGGVSHFCPQTDIYSLAATLYTLLKGNRPLNAFEIRHSKLPSLRASTNIVSAIKMAMSNDIEQRPVSVKHFVDLLLSDQGTAAPKIYLDKTYKRQINRLIYCFVFTSLLPVMSAFYFAISGKEFWPNNTYYVVFEVICGVIAFFAIMSTNNRIDNASAYLCTGNYHLVKSNIRMAYCYLVVAIAIFIFMMCLSYYSNSINN